MRCGSCRCSSGRWGLAGATSDLGTPRSSTHALTVPGYTVEGGPACNHLRPPQCQGKGPAYLLGESGPVGQG